MMWLMLAAGIVVLLFGFVVFWGAPYVPSKRRELEKMFTDLYSLTPSDTLLDLGSGDGIVLRQASRQGAQAVGYELNPLLVWVSRWLSRRDTRVRVELADIWRTPFPDSTTVVYIFAESRDIKKLTKKIEHEAQQLARDLWVISFGFALPGYTPHRTCRAYQLYRVTSLQKNKAQV